MRWIVPVLLAALLAGCGSLRAPGFPQAMELLPVDRRMPVLQARDLDRRVVVVTFFHPECATCQFWMRSVEETVTYVRESLAYDNPEVLDDLVSIYVVPGALGAGMDIRDEARTYLNHNNLTHPAYWDHQGWLTDRMPGTSIATYVFNREGEVVYNRRDARQVSHTAMRQLEEAILGAL